MHTYMHASINKHFKSHSMSALPTLAKRDSLLVLLLLHKLLDLLHRRIREMYISVLRNAQRNTQFYLFYWRCISTFFFIISELMMLHLLLHTFSKFPKCCRATRRPFAHTSEPLTRVAIVLCLAHPQRVVRVKRRLASQGLLEGIDRLLAVGQMVQWLPCVTGLRPILPFHAIFNYSSLESEM